MVHNLLMQKLAIPRHVLTNPMLGMKVNSFVQYINRVVMITSSKNSWLNVKSHSFSECAK